ncbi:MAG TPA: aminoglycoside phosphotransferase family protein [Candidatus Omnitrophota bacterium]|nr:aminoglycoside phosphotransferase family protein [Candidatus Omnitrophota bacterium]
MRMDDLERFSFVTRSWGLGLKVLRPDIEIAGSPERSEFRTVIEARDGRRYLLENVPARVCQRKKEIALFLDLLAEQGLKEVLPYRKAAGGGHLVEHQMKWWQLQPFVTGAALKRPDYAFEEWRGGVMADFLIALHRCGKAAGEAAGSEVFSLPSYIRGIIGDMREHDPKHLFRVEAAVRFLKEDFMGAYPGLPAAFCHGDYHPLNIIWSEDGIKAVIDWEFCGAKPELYDAANMVGCLGMEDPRSLDAECVRAFLRRLRESGVYQPVSWRYFIELIIANRFGWMAEWLRKKDRDMIELEGDYLSILLENRDYFRGAWT